MIEQLTISDYIASCREFILARSTTGSFHASDGEFDALALALFRLQFEALPLYRKFCERRGKNPGTVRGWREVPALPLGAFKEVEVSSIPPGDRIAEFHSSGTTGQTPSRHFHSHESLALYETALWPSFEAAVLEQGGSSNGQSATSRQEMAARLLILTPPPHEAPRSSLVHMFERVRVELGVDDCVFAGKVAGASGWGLDLDSALAALRNAVAEDRPMLLLGTAFSFVHLLDHCAAAELRFQLPEGSRVMETGGYKGRSRELSRVELHGLITAWLGVPSSRIICEYGMSELSSQAYASPLLELGGEKTGSATGDLRVFRFPAWARFRIISPETGEPVEQGKTGLIEIVDLANARSVMAVQTEDLGVDRGDGFDLLGRVAVAEARGCSLMAV